MRTLTTVISGGQTGVDEAALRAARDCGLTVGGWCPPVRQNEAGVIPAEFQLRETPNERSPDAPDVPRSQRTEWNVRDSDATLVIQPGGATADAGTEWALECAKRYRRPILVCAVEDAAAANTIRQWLEKEKIGTLNVAGPSESSAPGISARTHGLLTCVFENL